MSKNYNDYDLVLITNFFICWFGDAVQFHASMFLRSVNCKMMT
jgi:hypothetical protein